MKKGVKVLFLFLIIFSGIFSVSMGLIDNYRVITGETITYSYPDLLNKITGKTVEEGTCSGNVLVCNYYSYELTCGNVQGCLWIGNFCSGSPIQCSNLDKKTDCGSQPGCKWYGAPRPQETGTPQTPTTTSTPSSSQTPQTPQAPQAEFSDTGYIIEFQDEPIIVRKVKLEKEAREFEELRQRNPALATLLSPFRVSLDEVSGEVRSYSENLRRNHNQAKQRITDRISKQADRDYENVFNGVALDITQDEASSLLDLSEIKNIYPNREVNITLMDSVPLINADDVWLLDSSRNDCVTSGNECLTGQGVTIGIIDSGVDYTHGDLGGCFGAGCKVMGGYDFANNDNDPMDDHGHGTHVAATAAGNGVLKGVAPDANIVAYKVSRVDVTYWDAIIASIERSVDPNQDGNFDDHLDIISLSLGGWQFLNEYDAISVAIDNAVDAGVVAVVAAGNDGPSEGTINYPGISINAITVGAAIYVSSPNPIGVADFSSRGPVTIDLPLAEPFTINKPDIVAPGSSICAAKSRYLSSTYTCFDRMHISKSGTSMATPHVSGAVALLLQAYPTVSPSMIKNALTSTATDLGEPITAQGAGLINVQRAINSPLLQPLPPPRLPPQFTRTYSLQSDITYDPTRVLLNLKAFSPKCSCDTNSNTKDCPDTFQTTGFLAIEKCYDHYTTTQSLGGTTRILYGIRTYSLQSSPNQLPIIPLIPVLSVSTGDPISYDVDATDADGNTLTYSLTTNPGWLSIDSATGLITGTAPLVNVITDYGAVVSVSDGTSSVSQTFSIHVGLPLPPKQNETPSRTIGCRAYFSSCSCSYQCIDITTPIDCQQACSPIQRNAAAPNCGYVNDVCQVL